MSVIKAFRVNRFEQALAVDDSDDQDTCLFDAVDQPLAVNEAFTVRGNKLGHFSSVPWELPQTAARLHQLLDHLLGVERRVLLGVSGYLIDVFDSLGRGYPRSCCHRAVA